MSKPSSSGSFLFNIIYPNFSFLLLVFYHKQQENSRQHLQHFLEISLARLSNSSGIFSAFHIIADDSIAEMFANTQQRFPFLQFPMKCSSLPFEPSQAASTRSRFLLPVCSRQLRLPLLHSSISFVLPLPGPEQLQKLLSMCYEGTPFLVTKYVSNLLPHNKLSQTRWIKIANILSQSLWVSLGGSSYSASFTRFQLRFQRGRSHLKT